MNTDSEAGTRDDTEDAKTFVAAQRIEAIFNSLIAATRAHDFSTSTWSQYLDSTSFVSQNSFGRPSSFHEWLAELQAMAKECPSWTTKVLDFQTDVDVEKGVGTILSNTEVVNIPVGISRKTVEVHEFQRRDGLWKMVGHWRLPGWEAGVDVKQGLLSAKGRGDVVK